MNSPSETLREISTEDCWHFAGVINENGYGNVSFWLEGKTITFRAHRAMYETMHGVIVDSNLEINHLCRVRRCINPAHLEAVTHVQNMHYSLPYGGGFCRKGHEFTPENTVVPTTTNKDGSPHRTCRTCRTAREVKYTAQRRAARELARKEVI